MTALFERHLQVGGDPRRFSECAVLREELAKLNHPARPDVDWLKVEQNCLALFEHNGADLHTACFYTLARGHRHGLEGILQGVMVLEALCREWPRIWPPRVSMRLALLDGVCEQLQPLLRGQAACGPALAQLDAGLVRLKAQLPSPLAALEALRHLLQRMERNLPAGEALFLPINAPAPVIILPAPRKRHLALFVGVLSVAGIAAWWTDQARTPQLGEPIHLNSLSLFEAGSASLKPDSTKVLVNALVDIKAQPGWLIVIAGHTDTTGSVAQNLALSHARASAVRDWMQRMGDIADSCFAVQGFAASQPLAGNETEAGRSANRRVDIRLMPQAGACEQTPITAPRPGDSVPRPAASPVPG